MQTPSFVTKPAFSVVGLLIQVPPKSPEIPALWGQFGPRMGEVPHLAEPGASYGLMRNNDAQMTTIDYMAGEAVTQVENVPAGMTHIEVPANSYAVFKSTLATLPATFGEIYERWLPASGYQPANAPYFEYYGPDFNPDDVNASVTIYIPVEHL